MDAVQGGAARAAPTAQYMGIGLTKFWGLLKNDPTFPRPFKLGRTTLFYRAEIDAYLARQAQQRSTGAATTNPNPKFAELRGRAKRSLSDDVPAEHS